LPRRKKKNKNKGIDWGEFEAQYGWAKAVLTSNPELKKLANQARDESWTQARFVSAVRGTKWYRRHSEAERENRILKKTDPSEWRRRLEQMRRHLRTAASTSSGGKGIPEGWVNKAAKTAVRMGWTDEEVQFHAAKATQWGKLVRQDKLGGEAGQLEEFMRKAAGDYGVRIDNDWIASRIRNSMMGRSSQEVILNQIQEKAKARYASLADEIDQGLTVRDIAGQYMDTMAEVLELPVGQIDIFNEPIQRALNYRELVEGDKGKEDKKKPRAMPMWKFENQLRNDPRWVKTQNAQDSIMQTGHEVLRMFGVMG
jgi:hypothetical protein